MTDENVFANLRSSLFPEKPDEVESPALVPEVSGIPETPKLAELSPEKPLPPAKSFEEMQAERETARTGQYTDPAYQKAKRDALSQAVDYVNVSHPNLKPGNPSYYSKVKARRNAILQKKGFARVVEDEAPLAPTPKTKPKMTADEAIARKTKRMEKKGLQTDQPETSPMDMPERVAGQLEAKQAQLGGPSGRVLPKDAQGKKLMTEAEFEEQFTKGRKPTEEAKRLAGMADPQERITSALRGLERPAEKDAPSPEQLAEAEQRRVEGVETPFGRRDIAKDAASKGEFYTTPGLNEVATRSYQAWRDAWKSLFSGDFKGWAINNTAYMSEAVVGLWEMATGSEGAGSEEANRYVQEAMAASRESIRQLSTKGRRHDLSGFLKAQTPGLGERMAEAVVEGFHELTVTTRGSGAMVTSFAISGLNAMGVDGAKLLDPDMMIQSAMAANATQQFTQYTWQAQDSIEENSFLSDLFIEASKEIVPMFFEMGVGIASGGSSVALTQGSKKLTAEAAKKYVKRQAKLRAAGMAVTSAAEVSGRAMVDGYEYWTDLGYSPEQALAHAKNEALVAYAVTATTEYFAGKIVLEKIPGLSKHFGPAAARIARKGFISGVTGGSQEVAEEVLADAIISWSRDDESMLDGLIANDPEAWRNIALIFGVGAILEGPIGAIAGAIEGPKATKKELLTRVGEVSLRHKEARAKAFQQATKDVNNFDLLLEGVTDEELAQVVLDESDPVTGSPRHEVVFTGRGRNGTGYVNRTLSVAEAKVLLNRRNGFNLEENALRALQNVEPEKASTVRQKLGEEESVTDKRQLREDARGTLKPDVAFASGNPEQNTALREWVLDNPELARDIAEGSGPPSRSEMETIFNQKARNNSGANRARFWAAVQISANSLPAPEVQPEVQQEAAAPVETETAPQDSAGTLVEFGEEKSLTETPVEPTDPVTIEPGVEPDPATGPLSEDEQEVVNALTVGGEDKPLEEGKARRMRLFRIVANILARESTAENSPEAIGAKLAESIPELEDSDLQNLINAELDLGLVDKLLTALTLIENAGLSVSITETPNTREEQEAQEYAAERGVTILFYSGGSPTITGVNTSPTALAVRSDPQTSSLTSTLFHEFIHTFQNENPDDVVPLFQAIYRIAPEAVDAALAEYAVGLEQVNAQRRADGLPPIKWDANRVAMEAPAIVASLVADFIQSDATVLNELVRTQPSAIVRFINRLLQILGVNKIVLTEDQERVLNMLGEQSDDNFTATQKAQVASILKNALHSLKTASPNVLPQQPNFALSAAQEASLQGADAPAVLRPMETNLARYVREKMPKSKGLPLEAFTKDIQRPENRSLAQEATWRNWDHFVKEVTARRTADNNGKPPNQIRATREELEKFLLASAPVVNQHTKSNQRFSSDAIIQSKAKTRTALRRALTKGALFGGGGPNDGQLIPTATSERGLSEILQLLSGKFRRRTIESSDLQSKPELLLLDQEIRRLNPVLKDTDEYTLQISTRLYPSKTNIGVDFNPDDGGHAMTLNYEVNHRYDLIVRTQSGEVNQAGALIGTANLPADLTDIPVSYPLDTLQKRAVYDAIGASFTIPGMQITADGGITIRDLINSQHIMHTRGPNNLTGTMTLIASGGAKGYKPDREEDFVDNRSLKESKNVHKITVKETETTQRMVEVEDLFLPKEGAYAGLFSNAPETGNVRAGLDPDEYPSDGGPEEALIAAFHGVSDNKFLSEPEFAGWWFRQPSDLLTGEDQRAHTLPDGTSVSQYGELTISTYGLGMPSNYTSIHFSNRTRTGLGLVESELDARFTPSTPRVNLAGHIRYDVRTEPDGTRTLFVGEVQSDYQGDSSLYGVAPRLDPDEQPTRMQLVEESSVRVTEFTDEFVVEILNTESGEIFNVPHFDIPDLLADTQTFSDEERNLSKDAPPDDKAGAIDRQRRLVVNKLLELAREIADSPKDKVRPAVPSGMVGEYVMAIAKTLAKDVYGFGPLAQGDDPLTRPTPQLPLLDKEHHARGIMNLLGKQIVKLAAQNNIDRVAFTHGQTLDLLWSSTQAPDGVGFIYSRTNETLFVTETLPTGSDPLDKGLIDIVEVNAKDELNKDMVLEDVNEQNVIDKIRLPLINGKVSPTQLRRAFKRRASGRRNVLRSYQVSEIARAINGSDETLVKGASIPKPIGTHYDGKSEFANSDLKGPQAKRLKLFYDFFKSTGYGTRVGSAGTTEHNLLKSPLADASMQPLDIYEITEEAKKQAEDSDSGLYTVNFNVETENADGDNYDEVAEPGQYPERLPPDHVGQQIEEAVAGLLAIDTQSSGFEATYEIGLSGKDIKGRHQFLGNLLFTALNSSNKLVQNTASQMVYAEMRNRRLELEQDEADSRYYDSLPSQYTKENGAEFFRLMDEVKVAPEDIDTHPETKDLPLAVRKALAHYKARGEDMRINLRDAKRDALARSARYMKLREIAEQANKLLPEGATEWQVKRLPRRSDPTRKRDYIIDSNGNRLLQEDGGKAFAELAIPDDWGYQYEHIHHAFFGTYDLGYLDEKAYRAARRRGRTHHEAIYTKGVLVRMGTADSQGDAAEKLIHIAKEKQGTLRDNAVKGDDGKPILMALPQVQVPSDVAIRMSSKQHAVLLSKLQQAGGTTSQEVFEATRGIVGTRSSQNPFYAAMLERGGAEGYSTDFWRVWQMQRRGYRRYMLGREIAQIVHPASESLSRVGLTSWAETFNKMADYIIYPASDKNVSFVERAFDSAMEAVFGGPEDQGLKVFRLLRADRYLGHRPLRRFAHTVRAFNYFRMLKTVRQHVINSFQPLQTVWPLVGEIGFLRALRLYHSKEGKAILAKFGPSPEGSLYKDAPLGGSGVSTVKAFRAIQRVGRVVLNRVPYEIRSEVRNQNFAFLAMYDHAVNKLGMSEQEAAEFAMVRGVVMTQYAFTRTTQPPFLRGPLTSTAFQFKRFLVNQVQLAYAMLHRGRSRGDYRTTGLGAFARFSTMQFLLGGVRGLVPLALYQYMFKPGFCALFPSVCEDLGTPDSKDDIDEARLFIEELTGSESVANSIAYGMFAGTLDIDISGSVALLDRPYGRNAAEVIGNQFLGPTGTSLIRLGTDLSEKTTEPISTGERIFKSVLDTSPSINQLTYMSDAYNATADYLDGVQEMDKSTTPIFNSQGEFQYEATVGDLFRKMCGFRTMSESEISGAWAHQQAVYALMDGVKDEMATFMAIGDYETALEISAKHNALYPELKVYLKDARARANNKKDARETPVQERREDRASRKIERYLRERNK